ncbi:MAG: class I SAM-dependent methyltransferase [bacterium]|nr:class I SAM-dependent methyltransferase [bacterium]
MNASDEGICILCSSRNFHPVFALTERQDPSCDVQTALPFAPSKIVDYEVVTCAECGFSFRSTTGTRADDTSPRLSAGVNTTAGKLNIRDARIDEIEEISQFRCPPGTFLNVGSDLGEIVETARIFGWHPTTITSIESEIRSDAQPICPPNQPDGKYDVLRLEGSLENSFDPRAYLRNVSRLLKNKGVLVISMTDCSDWDFPVFGEGASLWRTTLPRWFFTPSTLSRLLALCGFKVLKVTSTNVTYLAPQTTEFSDFPINTTQFAFDLPDHLPALKGEARYFRIYATPNEGRMAAPATFSEWVRLPDENLQEI